MTKLLVTYFLSEVEKTNHPWPQVIEKNINVSTLFTHDVPIVSPVNKCLDTHAYLHFSDRVYVEGAISYTRFLDDDNKTTILTSIVAGEFILMQTTAAVIWNTFCS